MLNYHSKKKNLRNIQNRTPNLSPQIWISENTAYFCVGLFHSFHFFTKKKKRRRLKKKKSSFSRNRRKAQTVPLEQVEVSNGLECKMCLSTYRLFFVEDTEDFLYRRGARARAREISSEKRTSRFNLWASNLSR